MNNEIFKDRRRRLSSSSEDEFMKLSDGNYYPDQDTYKSEEDKKPDTIEPKMRKNLPYKPRPNKGRGANNWRIQDKPKQKQGSKPQFRKKVGGKFDLNAQEFQPEAKLNIFANEFVRNNSGPHFYQPNCERISAEIVALCS